MAKFIKTCDQYPRNFNFGHFFSSIILPLSTGEKEIFNIRCSREMGTFLLPGVVMIRACGRVLLGEHE